MSSGNSQSNDEPSQLCGHAQHTIAHTHTRTQMRIHVREHAQAGAAAGSTAQGGRVVAAPKSLEVLGVDVRALRGDDEVVLVEDLLDQFINSQFMYRMCALMCSRSVSCVVCQVPSYDKGCAFCFMNLYENAGVLGSSVCVCVCQHQQQPQFVCVSINNSRGFPSNYTLKCNSRTDLPEMLSAM